MRTDLERQLGGWLSLDGSGQRRSSRQGARELGLRIAAHNLGRNLEDDARREDLYARNGEAAAETTMRKGVTLIELLVVITLLGLVSLGLLFAMRVGVGAWQRANARMSADRRVVAASDLI